FPVFRVQPALSRFVRRVDRRPVSEELSRRCCLPPVPSFRSFSFVGVVPARRLLYAGGKEVFSLTSVRGSHRSSGFHWTVGLRYFLIPLATGVMIFGTGYIKKEWRQYCLGGRKRRRFSFATDFDDPPYAPSPPSSPSSSSSGMQFEPVPSPPSSPSETSSSSSDFEPAPVPPLPDPASIPSILKKKEEDGQKKEEDGEEKRRIRFGPDVKKE
ncbi:hypothetical protein C0J52_09584, partial [Blattella germanica]